MHYHPGLKDRQFNSRREILVKKIIGLRRALDDKLPRKDLNRNLLVAPRTCGTSAASRARVSTPRPG